MDFKNMNMEEVEARLSSIAVELDTESADVEALSAEVESLEARKTEIIAEAEARQALLDDVAKTEITQPVVEEEVKRMFEINSVEYRNAWLKNLQGNELTVEERTGYDQSNISAIPTMVSDKMFAKMKKVAPMLNEITLLRVAGDVKFVVEGVRDSVSSHTENAAISAASDTTVAVTLGAVEFYKIIAISESAKRMSVDAFENWLVELLSADIARAIENYIINGGNYGIADITFTTGTNQIFNTTYTLKSVLDLVGKLPAAYDAEAKFLTNKTTLYSKIANITYSNGQSVFIPDARDGFGTILGYPVLVSDYVTTGGDVLYLGKWTDVVGNLSEDINVISYPDYDHASIKFRGGAHFDSKVAKTDAIVRLVTTA